jgi:hypothetical protein
MRIKLTINYLIFRIKNGYWVKYGFAIMHNCNFNIYFFRHKFHGNVSGKRLEIGKSGIFLLKTRY